MKTLLTTLLAGLAVALAAAGARADDAKFDKHGVTFTYPKDGWTIKDDAKKDVTTITAANDKGTTVTITLNGPEVDPKTLAGELDKTFKNIFKDKVVKDSDKPAKRKLLGAEREGQTLEIKIAEGVTSKLEYYAFPTPSKKNTISVTLQTVSFDADAKKVVDMIADSLMEAKK
jgi:hypothetical protein